MLLSKEGEIVSEYIITNGELYHYGVRGMRWGVRKGNVSGAFAKASKKARRLETKSTKLKLKSAKLDNKAMKIERRSSNEKKLDKARKMHQKAIKLSHKSAKLQVKGMKWVKSMEKVFSKVSMSDVSQDALDAGRKYTYMLMR